MPSGFYNLELMLGSVARNGGGIGVCGCCMEARGIAAQDLVEGVHRRSMEELCR